MIRRLLWCWVGALTWVVERMNEFADMASDWADDPLFDDERAE